MHAQLQLHARQAETGLSSSQLNFYRFQCRRAQVQVLMNLVERNDC